MPEPVKPTSSIFNVTVNSDQKDLNPPVPPKLLPMILGDSGTERYGGYFFEEFSSDWRDEKRIINVELMRRTDATVKQLLNAIKAPILAAEWDVECGSDDPKDQEIEEFVRQNIFNMKRTWKDFLREALTYFDFGFSVFEQIYELRTDGKIWLADMQPRIQHSILKWTLDDGTHGVTQLVKSDEGANVMAQIPLNKLLVLTNDKEGDDMTGQSVLRPAWKHWYYKDTLYRIAAVAAERWGVGIPLITMPDTSGPKDKDAAVEMARNIRANEKGYIILPSDKWKAEILTPQGGGSVSSDMKSQVDHHDRMILVAGLAAFLNLGSTDTGSFALSSDQRGFFLTHILDKVSYFAEQYSKQVIARLVELNFGKVKNMPKLIYTNVGESDLSIMATYLKTLSDADLIKVDAKLKEWIHKNFKLPPLTEEDITQMETADIDAELAGMELPPEDDGGGDASIDQDFPEPEAEEPEEEEEIEEE